MSRTPAPSSGFTAVDRPPVNIKLFGVGVGKDKYLKDTMVLTSNIDEMYFSDNEAEIDRFKKKYVDGHSPKETAIKLTGFSNTHIRWMIPSHESHTTKCASNGTH